MAVPHSHKNEVKHMTQEERRMYLIRALLEENPRYPEIPPSDKQQKMLLRSLMNVRPPRPISAMSLS